MIENMELMQVLNENLDSGNLCDEDELKIYFVESKNTWEDIWDDDIEDDRYTQVIRTNRKFIYRGWRNDLNEWRNNEEYFDINKTDCYSLLKFDVEKFKNGNIKKCVLKEMLEINRSPPNKTGKNVRKRAK